MKKNDKIVKKKPVQSHSFPIPRKCFLLTIFAKANGDDKAAELVKAVINQKIHLA